VALHYKVGVGDGGDSRHDKKRKKEMGAVFQLRVK
jgi:hypothetical protein